MLSFKHKVFMEVARQLSFTKASQALFISQPAITRHIQQLEDLYKVRLFDRSASSISLTDAGKLLYQYLMRAREVEKELEFAMTTWQDPFKARGDLKLGASTTVALYIIPAVLSGFRHQYPDVSVSLLNRNSENVMKALLDQEIDLGILEGKSKMKGVHTEHFLTDEVVPVCSPRSPLVRSAKLSVKDLPTIPVALRERGSGTLAALKTALADHGLKLTDLKSGIRLGGTEALKNFLLADTCLGFLPLRAVSKELLNGDLIRLSIDKLSITRQFYFVMRQGDHNNRLITTFIRFAKSYYNLSL
jgi:DNA-binding transcriptional LysR family regulator